jgi:hypothetical protein
MYILYVNISGIVSAPVFKLLVITVLTDILLLFFPHATANILDGTQVL